MKSFQTLSMKTFFPIIKDRVMNTIEIQFNKLIYLRFKINNKIYKEIQVIIFYNFFIKSSK